MEATLPNSIVAAADKISCPFCNSRDLRGLELADSGETILVCMGCAKAFEPETRTEPCVQMCNNCAFRPGSPERADPWKWLRILETTIENGHPFHCHKNLQLEITAGGYRFVQPPNGAEAMIRCAGWQSRRAAYAAGVPLHKL